MSMCLRYYASMNLSWKTVGRQNIESLAMFCIRASMNLLFWQFGESNRFMCDSGGNFLQFIADCRYNATLYCTALFHHKMVTKKQNRNRTYTGWLKIKYPTVEYAISPEPVV